MNTSGIGDSLWFHIAVVNCEECAHTVHALFYIPAVSKYLAVDGSIFEEEKISKFPADLVILSLFSHLNFNIMTLCMLLVVLHNILTCFGVVC